MNSTSIPPVTYPWKLSMCVKDFKHVSPKALNNSVATPEGPHFHIIHCTSHLFNLNSTHCALYITSVSAITPFIFNIYQLFHMLLPDFLSIIHSYFHCPTFIFKTTSPNNILLPTFCLAILNNSWPSRHQSTFSTASRAFWCIAIYTTLLSSFFASQFFFISSSFQYCFQILNNFLYAQPRQHLYSTNTFQNAWFAFSVTTDFTCNI